MMRKIAVVSGSRADAGLLMGLMHAIHQHPSLQLQLVITGMHLAQQYGLTYKELEDNGLNITARVNIPLDDNSPQGNARALGEGVIGFSHTLQQLQPDIVVLLGDRLEIFAAAQAAMMLQIPIAHLHGGELTLGAIDDAIRHAISKMAQLHFTATEVYRQRLIQMGEQPQRVYNVGATAIDNILSIPLLDKKALQDSLDVILKDSLFLITWHPETIKYSAADTLSGLKELLRALEQFPEHQLIFTRANSDSDGEQINNFLQNYCAGREMCFLYTSLGIQRYLSMVKIADAVIGNSSSGLLEVPAMKAATVNIGHRQDGRYKPASVIDCAANSEAIFQAIATACSDQHKNKCQTMALPYGDGHSSTKITDILATIELADIMYKPFYEPEPLVKDRIK